MAVPIKSIIFDVGHVFVTYEPDYIIDQILGDSEHRQFYVDNLFLGDVWLQMDRGDHTHESAIQFLDKKLQLSDLQKSEMKLLLENYGHHLGLIQGTRDIFLDLKKQNFDLYILSNFQDEPFQQVAKRFTFLNDVIGQVVSARVNSIKPEPEIYRHLIDTHKLEPEKCLFIDDRQENLDAAEKFGIQTILFRTPQALHTQLKKKGILVSIPILSS